MTMITSNRNSRNRTIPVAMCWTVQLAVLYQAPGKEVQDQQQQCVERNEKAKNTVVVAYSLKLLNPRANYLSTFKANWAKGKTPQQKQLDSSTNVVITTQLTNSTNTLTELQFSAYLYLACWLGAGPDGTLIHY